MKDLLISLDSNILKVSYCGPDGCAGFSQEISQDIVSDSKILNPELFARKLIELSSSLLPLKKKPDALTFIVPPENVLLAFHSVSKGETPVQDQLCAEASSKINVPLESLYFTHFKIAPFVYQFIGVDKDYLESLVKVSNLWGVPIRSVVPWVLLLPKTLPDSSPSIFVGNFDDKYIVALSELNGIYFSASYDEEKTEAEISDLVRKLSVYNRSSPIQNVYTVNASFSIGGAYKVHPILEQERYLGQEGFEIHDLTLRVLKDYPDILNSYINLLNLLPLPKVRAKTNSLVSASVAVSVVALLLAGFFWGMPKFSKTASLIPVADNVLGGETKTPESSLTETPTREHKVDSENSQVLKKASQYTKKDMIIRIENASEVNGAAARTKALLEGLGYKVESIGTSSTQLESSQVLITKPLMELRDELKRDLGDKVPVSVVDTLDELSPNEEYSHNVLIRLGKDAKI